MLACGEWLEDNVLALVPHRQYVFSLPKLIRPFFRHRRRYLQKRKKAPKGAFQFLARNVQDAQVPQQNRLERFWTIANGDGPAGRR